MAIDGLMSRLRELKVTLRVENGQLNLRAPKGVMTPALAQELSARKAEILAYLQRAEATAAAEPGGGIVPVPRVPPLPLSFGQQRLWFLDRLEGPSATYTMPLAVRLEGVVNADALQQALNEIVRRHEALRANFAMENEQPVIRIREAAECPLCVVGANLFAPGSGEAANKFAPTDAAHSEAIRHWVDLEARRSFDLARDPLLHATLVKLGGTSHLFLVTMHHIVSDGWSLGVFIRELAALYTAFCQNRPSPLPDLAIQYLDYAHWQRQRLQGDTLAGLLGYWRGKLAGAPAVLDLPTDRPRPPVQTYRGHSLDDTLDAGLAAGVRALAQASGTTLFMTLLAGFAALLARYSGQRDLVIGTAVANRHPPESEALIGLFINTLALRLDLSGDPPLREFLERVRQTCLEAYQHQEVPFEQLVEDLKPPRSLSHAPLFQVSFDVQNTPRERVEMPGLNLVPVEQEAVAAKLDLGLSMEDSGSTLTAVWTYNPDLFDAATIARMMGHYRALLGGMVAAGRDAPLSVLPLLDEAERRHLVYACNATAREYPQNQTFLDLFDAQADAHPDRVAVVFGGQSLTYRRLRQRAEQLAAALRGLGVGPEVLVWLCVERSLDLVVGLLGILKAGGAYIPLDPAYPRERLAAVLDDARPLALLTQTRLVADLPPTTARVLCLDGGRGEFIRPVAGGDGQGGRINSPLPGSANAAYVIYTSGSTGRPKGVQINHRALLNFLLSMRDQPGLGERDALLAVTTVSFDIAGLEIYLPLIVGARLVLAGRETTLDGRGLQTALAEHGITAMQATPATWRLLLDSGWTPAASLNLFCGGEAVPVALARRLVAGGARLWNLYGPTETTVWSAAREILPPTTGSDALPEGVEAIGPPIANTQIHILDRQFRPQPVGVPGELYIGGDGLARGYLNRPGLTAAAYGPDPFATAPGARLYKTGDLARRLPEGGFDFLGRLDHQVKIRGFRIELGDIEAALGRCPGIRAAVVLAREDSPGDKRLVAYLVADSEPPPTAGDLRARLKDSLPEYMLPVAWVFLAGLPLTPNGKLDRRALPAPEGHTESGTAYVAPRGDLESTIAEVWRQALGVERVGIDDNFFDLGGHSLLVARVHEALRQRLAEPFPLLTLFQYPTIRGLAARLAGGEQPAPVRVRPAVPRQTGGDIAVIGLAGRFPGADDLESFWANLREGRESIRFFSEAELLAAGVEPELVAQPNYVRANGALSDIAGFDAGFFGFTPGEAETMDPQHRLFLECAWHALEHAGHAGRADGAAVGVFAGCGHNGYLIHNLLPRLHASANPAIYQAILGSEKDFLPTRVAYAFDLKGPAVNVQTACSTSLVAVHLACRSLLDGECDMALAGGVALKIPQESGYLYEEGMIHSPDGHCRTFDAEARGTTWGSGVGAVLLKPLAAALADRDTIHAVIKGSAINNDGALKVGFTAPGVEGQAEVIANALARAGVAPADIGYVETHGTGTPLGDPIEIAALTRAFRLGAAASRICALGAVKTNIGHLDAAAGLAGLAKTILALQHRQLPPTLHFQRPNPEIDFEHGPFYVNERLRDWPAGNTPRRAGVSSFGIGGTNAHVILEEAPPPEASASSRPWRLLVLSARTPTALELACAGLAAHLRQHPQLDTADAAYTLAVGRRHFGQRAAVICHDAEDAATALLAAGRVPSEPAADHRPVVFMFPGQGAQYAGMGAELYRAEPVFREWIDHCAEKLRDDLGLDLREILYPAAEQREAAAEKLEQTWLTQPALFVTEYALARLWMAWGIAPAAMIGHSLGEYVAACLAGVFDLDAALHLVARRGRLLWEQPRGAMLAVSLPEREAETLLGDEISLAAVNAPESCVLAGSCAAIDALAARLEQRGVACRRLRTSHAFHSALVEPAAEAFAPLLASVELRAPQLPFVSNLTGTWIQPEQATDPAYWARHLRRTVRFAAGIGEILADPARVLLEVGPGAALGSLARAHPLGRMGRAVLASLRRPESGSASAEVGAETRTLLDSLGRVWSLGVEVDWVAFHAHERLRRVPLPGYPFERQRYWIAPPAAGLAVREPARAGGKLPLDHWFYLPAWKPALAPRPLCPEDFAGPDAPWLVLDDDTPLGRELGARLRRENQEVIEVRRGEGFESDGSGYRLRPGVAEDYAALFHALGGRPIRAILHLWTLADEDSDGPDAFEPAQTRGYYSLLNLGRALAQQPGSPGTTLAVITRRLHDADGQGDIAPERATLLGPCLVMPQEWPQLACRCWDVGEFAPGEVADLAGRLLAELQTGAHEPLVAYRGRRRWVPGFERVALPAADSVRNLRQRGAYLITGGLGRVGLLFARFLAETVQARLVLVGRSWLPERGEWAAWLDGHPDSDPLAQTLRRLLDLEQLGAEVLPLRADVADERALRAALALARERFGDLHGVIHAAGNLSDPSFTTAFADLGLAESQAQFLPKVQGVYVLDRLLAGQDLDFCLLVSSTAAVLGGLGFAAYSAANSFLDAYAARRNRQGGTPWLSVNWDAWRFDPSGADSPEEFAMTPAESVEALRRLLAQVSAGRVVAATGDPEARYARWVRREGWDQNPVAVEQRHARPELAASYLAPVGMAETRLAAIWAELLGFERVGADDDFFELGGNSLLAIQLLGRIKQDFGRQLPLTALLDRPSVRQLAETLAPAADAEPEPAEFSPLVAIQPKGSRPPLFCVPGTGGNVLYFNDLARCLAEYDRPFYAFQALGLDGRAAPLTRIEDIAAMNVDALLKLQPHGPYHLAGHSFGSWVAFEMAWQLRQRGREVARLVVLDTGAGWERDHSAMGGWDDSRWLVAVAEILGHLYGKPLVLDPAQLAPLAWAAQLDTLTRAMERQGIVPPGTGNDGLRGFVEVYKAQAQIRYRPDPQARARVALFRAEQTLADFLEGMPEALRQDPSWGWRDYSEGEPWVERVPGDHLTMMNPPQVRALALALERALSAP